MKRALPLLGTLLAACTGAPAAGLRSLCEAARPAEVAVAFVDLGTGTGEDVAADLPMHAASTMKIAVMISAFRADDDGSLPLQGRIAVHNRFRSVVDGSHYALDPTDDSETGLYTHLGETMSRRELVRRMIVRSSNLATNLLIDELTPARIAADLRALGCHDMQVRRGVEDGKAFRAGIVNVATAGDLARQLGAIATHRAASTAACEQMLAILQQQEFNSMIPAGLPPGTTVAHKTGWITGIRHDAAIVMPPRAPAFVLVVLTRGFADPAAADRTGAAIAAKAWSSHAARHR